MSNGVLQRSGWRVVVALVVLVAAARAPAAAEGLSLGVAAGTLGAGAQLGVSFSPRLGGRLGVFGGAVDEDFEASGVDYSGELDLGHLGALLDFHPAATGFRFTVGVVYNDTELSGEAPASELLELADLPPLPPDVEIPPGLGTLRARTRPEQVVPYVGLGYSRAAGRGLSFTFDLGAYYQGSLDVESELDTTLPIDQVPGARAALDALLAEHERDLEEEVEDYRIYPVIMVGLGYRF